VKSSIYRPSHGGDLVWAAALAGCPPASLVDFSASINPLGPPAGAIAAIQSHLPTLRSYPDPTYGELRSALAAFHGIPADWILPGNGAAELLTWACRELAEQPPTWLITPAFGDYRRALQAFDAGVVDCPLKLADPAHPPGWQLDSDLLQGKSGGLLLNNPHNPTGLLLSRDAMLPYLAQFSLVVVDEAFMDFLPASQEQSLIESVSTYPNLVIVRSLTKFYSLPGLRLGYAIAHPERLQRWQQWRDPWSVNSLAAAAGVVAVQDTGFQQQTWEWLVVARQHLWQGLANLPGLDPFPAAANFLLVRSEYPVPDLQTTLLQRHRILIRDCLSFPELGDRYFRVAVRTIEDNQRLLGGLADAIALVGV